MRTRILFCGLAVYLAAAIAFAPAAAAFHAPPWDTGHDRFDADPGIPRTDPGSERMCPNASPVEVSTGNFVYALPQFAISGIGPRIDLTLIYNSHDLRKGPFGRGWTHAYEERLVVTTDGAQVFAICCQGRGKRERMSRSADGRYVNLTPTFVTLTRNQDQTHTIRDKHGRVREFDADGKLVRIVDRNSNAVTLGYDATGFLTTITDATGRVLRFTKGPNGRVASMTDPANHVSQFSYDNSGNLVKVADPLGQAWTFSYASNGLMSEIVDPRGKTQMNITYDASRRVSVLMEKDERWEFTYNENEKRTKKEDWEGNDWTFEYNDTGSITRATDPNGHVIVRAYDSDRNLTAFTDGNGNTTRYTYDASGNVLSMTDALGNKRTIAYESIFNLPVAITDPVGNTTTLQYDARGNLLSVTEPNSAVRRFEYNARGQMTRVVDPLGNATTLAFDAHGNVVSVIEPGKNAATASFDVLGDILTLTDPRSNTYQFAYDAARRLVRTTNPAGGAIVRQYDASGNLTALTLPNATTFTFAYDTFSRLTQSTNPLQKVVSYEYNRHDNVTRVIDPNGLSIYYTYDGADRLTTKRTFDDTLTYSYDAAGNLTDISTTSSGRLQFTLNAMNQVTRVVASPQQATVSYSYDAAGRLLTIDDGAGGVIRYGYNLRSLVTTITDFDGFAATFNYDVNRRRSRMDRTGGFSAVYTYDAANRLLSVAHTSPAGPLSFAYVYDQADNRERMTDQAGQHTYGYNRRDHLVSAVHPTTVNPQETFTYDPVGNRATSHLSPSYTYDAANRLLADSRFDYTYDENGNTLSRKDRASGGVRSYEYNAENRITKIVFADGSTATYRYDPLGRRSEKTVGGQTTRYVYAGASILREIDANGNTVARYTPGLYWDETLAVRRNGVIHVLETDGLGSVARTVGNGAATSTYTYDSYGQIIAQTGTPPTPFAFQGREYDAESRLYYYRARHYDPRVGRFLTEDPIGLTGGWNVYAFVRNNPLNHFDLLGLASVEISAGFHVPFSPGIAVGYNFSVTIPLGTGAGIRTELSTDWAGGVIADVGMSASVSDLSGTGGQCEAPFSVNADVVPLKGAKGAGLQITPRRSIDPNAPWWYPSKYIDAISVGAGVGLGSPVNVSGAGTTIWSKEW